MLWRRLIVCRRLLILAVCLLSECWLRLHVLLLLKLGQLSLMIDHLLLNVVLDVALDLWDIIALELLFFILPVLLSFKSLELREIHLTAHRRLLRRLLPLVRVRLISVALSVVTVALLSVLIVGLFHLHGPVLND